MFKCKINSKKKCRTVQYVNVKKARIQFIVRFYGLGSEIYAIFLFQDNRLKADVMGNSSNKNQGGNDTTRHPRTVSIVKCEPPLIDLTIPIIDLTKKKVLYFLNSNKLAIFLNSNLIMFFFSQTKPKNGPAHENKKENVQPKCALQQNPPNTYCDITFCGSFQAARDYAKNQNRWLIINVQNMRYSFYQLCYTYSSLHNRVQRNL